MGAIHDWATLENLQPEPISVEIWRELPEEFCRQVEVVNGQAVRCEAEYASAGIPFYWLVWISDNRVASIDVHVLDHALGAYRLLRTLAPEDEVSVIEVARSH